MKILFVIPHFYPAVSFGGPAVAVYELARNLADRGHNIAIYTSDVFDRYSRISLKDQQNILDQGLNIRYFPALSTKLAYQYNGYFTPGFFREFINNAKTFDVIHVHEIFTIQNLFAGYMASKYHIPWVLSAHGSLTKSEMRGKRAVKSVFTTFGKRIFLKADGFIALTKFEKIDYLNWGMTDKKVYVIPNGVEQPKPVLTSDKKRILSQIRIPHDKDIILYLGRLHPIKRLDLIIESYKILHLENPKSFLIIAGPDAGDLHRLQNLAKNLLPENSYLFTGSVESLVKSVLYSIAQVFILTSYSEGLPHTILEAASYGIPIIATTTCSFPDFRRYHAGLLVNPDKTQIAHALNRIINNPRLLEDMSIGAKRMVSEKYSWKSITDHYVKLYKSFLNRSIRV